MPDHRPQQREREHRRDDQLVSLLADFPRADILGLLLGRLQHRAVAQLAHLIDDLLQRDRPRLISHLRSFKRQIDVGLLHAGQPV
ncbi:hypothetical protein D3C76_1419750 [compost metagenome]